jgi:hypothetical protein
MIENFKVNLFLRDCRQSEFLQSNGRASYYAARGYGSDQVTGPLERRRLVV